MVHDIIIFMMKKDKKNQGKINKQLSNVLIVYSFAIIVIYAAIAAGTRVVKELQPSSIAEIYQILAFLSLFLLLPSAVISISIFARIMSSKSSWLSVVLISALPTVLIWVVLTLVFSLLNIDRFTVYGIDLV